MAISIRFLKYVNDNAHYENVRFTPKLKHWKKEVPWQKTRKKKRLESTRKG